MRGFGIVLGLSVMLNACGGSGSDSSTSSSIPSSSGSSSSVTKINITTLAGNAYGPGNIDGTGPAAWFNQPRNMVVDIAGNLYLADSYNSVIRKISINGVVSVFAGSSSEFGSADGTLSTARFHSPHGITLDKAGNFYVADWGNCTIRKISSAGFVTTLAGSPRQCGFVDGTGANARFPSPTAVAVGNSGTIYVADDWINIVRSVSETGVVKTIAGDFSHGVGRVDGKSYQAVFGEVNGIAVDASENVYVADGLDSFSIRKIAPNGDVTTLAGGSRGSADGTGAKASFQRPIALSFDTSGNLLVTDGNAIRRVTMTGDVSTVAGVADSGGSNDGIGTTARFNYPMGVTTDSSGNIFVGDTYSNTIRRISTAGIVATYAGILRGNSGSADGSGLTASFNFPIGITPDSQGNLYVADYFNRAIRKISPDATVTTIINSVTSISTNNLYLPSAIAIDSSGTLYVTDTGNHAVYKISSSGSIAILAGKQGQSGSADGNGENARFNGPTGIALSNNGNVYVSDTSNNSIRMITPAGEVTTINTGAFYSPCQIAFDNTGNLYVADSGNHRIAKMSSSGVVTTVAGKMGVHGSTDGIGTNASFYDPYGLAFDASGNLFVTDRWNNTIRRVSPAGVVTTLAGQAGISGFDSNSPGIFYQPWGIAVIGKTIYTAMNNGIISITPAD